jgi:hypothetical protein
MTSAQPLFLLVLAAVAIYLMMVAGVQKHALERRQPRRICPSCGRDAARGCRCTRR